MNVTFIGGGNMARALLGGMIARGHASGTFAVVDPDPEARATVAARFGVATFPAIEPPAAGNADVIVIAVKPQQVRGVDGDGRTNAAAVLEAAGGIMWCEREDELDAVTAVSGSGPAYVFYFLEALEQAARELGFAPAEARRLAYATFSGAIRLAEQSDSEPALLRAQVTSKGGTTERAIAVLDDATVKVAIAAAVKAAEARAKELGEILGGES